MPTGSHTLLWCHSDYSFASAAIAVRRPFVSIQSQVITQSVTADAKASWPRRLFRRWMRLRAGPRSCPDHAEPRNPLYFIFPERG